MKNAHELIQKKSFYKKIYHNVRFCIVQIDSGFYIFFEIIGTNYF